MITTDKEKLQKAIEWLKLEIQCCEIKIQECLTTIDLLEKHIEKYGKES